MLGAARAMAGRRRDVKAETSILNVVLEVGFAGAFISYAMM